MLKSKRGISLTTMVITIMIMLIIMGTLVYSALDSVKIRKLNNLYNDLRELDDAVGIYYLKNGKLPLLAGESVITVEPSPATIPTTPCDMKCVLKEGVTEVTGQDSFLNPNDFKIDRAEYGILDVHLMDNLTLKYPKDNYIVNLESHTVYNATGVKIDGTLYYALPLEYKYTQYNETHPVTSIGVKSISGVTDGNTIYCARNLNSINLRDYLIFNHNTEVGKGEPKNVTFSSSSSAVTGNGVFTPSTINAGTNVPVTVVATNYNSTYGSVTSTINVTVHSIKIQRDSNDVNEVNLLLKHNNTETTYVSQRDSVSSEYTLNKSNGSIAVTTETENANIANASVNGNAITFTSASSDTKTTGRTTINFKGTNYGKPETSILVNVFDYKIYKSPVGSNTNITNLELTDIGATTNLSCNMEAPDGFDKEGRMKVIWSNVKLASGSTNVYEADTSGIIGIVVDSTDATGRMVKVTPNKPGKTFLKCELQVKKENADVYETLGISIIPVTVSGVVLNSSNALSITKTKAELASGVQLSYVFGDSSITSTDNVEVSTTSSGFDLSTINGNTFTIKYSGNDVNATITVQKTVGSITYTEKITVVVSGNNVTISN